MKTSKLLFLGFLFLLACSDAGKNSTSVSSRGEIEPPPPDQMDKPFEGKPANFDGYWKGLGALLPDKKQVELSLSISGYPGSLVIKYQFKGQEVDGATGIFIGASISENKILDVDGKTIGRIGPAGYEINSGIEKISARLNRNGKLSIEASFEIQDKVLQFNGFLHKIR